MVLLPLLYNRLRQSYLISKCSTITNVVEFEALAVILGIVFWTRTQHQKVFFLYELWIFLTSSDPETFA